MRNGVARWKTKFKAYFKAVCNCLIIKKRVLELSCSDAGQLSLYICAHVSVSLGLFSRLESVLPLQIGDESPAHGAQSELFGVYVVGL